MLRPRLWLRLFRGGLAVLIVSWWRNRKKVWERYGVV